MRAKIVFQDNSWIMWKGFIKALVIATCLAFSTLGIPMLVGIFLI
jgi:hypothetical protein